VPSETLAAKLLGDHLPEQVKKKRARGGVRKNGKGRGSFVRAEEG